MGNKCPECGTDNQKDSRFCHKCATPLPELEGFGPTHTLETPVEELSRGALFAGRYEIIEELGSGGMGKVYRVEDKKVGEEVALKLVRPEIATDKKMIERFSRELRTARKISHRNICRMFDLGEDKGTRFITMEYVRGEDLKSMIRMSGQLGIGTAIGIAKQICEGLTEAHRLGVIHRDLKPNNIMIDKEGSARIMDFGIARPLRAKGITGPGAMIGTPEYMSPEQVEAKEVDERSDIYSLGILLYEMLTGRIPFEGDSVIAVGIKQKSEQPAPPVKFNARISEDLNRVILKCLEKDKAARYQSAAELCSELSRIEEGLPTTEREGRKRKTATSKQVTVTFMPKKLVFPIIGVILLVLAVLFIPKLFKSKDAPLLPSDKPSLAVVYFRNNTGQEGLDHWREAIAELLITDLTQSKYIRVVGRDKLQNILRQLDMMDKKSFSSSDLKEIADKGRVHYVLQGAFTKAGESFRINYSLREPDSEEQLVTEILEGQGEESIFRMVDEITPKVKSALELTKEELTADIDRSIGVITTSSPEAYGFFMEGSNFHDEAKYQEAIQSYQKAIALDPEFASSYRAMGTAYNNILHFAESRACLEKAYELSDRISDRERMRIEAEYFRRSQTTYDKAIEAYSRLLEIYPDDEVGNNNLGVLYDGLEEWGKALDRYQYLIDIGLASTLQYTNVAEILMNKGLYGDAERTLKDYFENFPDNFSVHLTLSDVYLSQGKYDLALSELEEAFAINPTHYDYLRVKGNTYLCREDQAAAEESFMTLFNHQNPFFHAWGIHRLGYLRMLQGRIKEAESLAEEFLALAEQSGQKLWEIMIRMRYLGRIRLYFGSPEEALGEFVKARDIAIGLGNSGSQRNAIYHIGLAYIEMNELDKAQKTMEELKVLCRQSMNTKIMRLYYNLAGLIELEKKNFPSALELIKTAESMDPFIYKNSTESLARVYYLTGDLENARAAYERIISNPKGMLDHGLDFIMSYYMLGLIHERQGDNKAAEQNYEKYLEFRKNADPGIAEVEDARKRLAEIKAADR